MKCGFCAKRISKFIVSIQGKDIHICQICNQRWQLQVKEGAE